MSYSYTFGLALKSRAVKEIIAHYCSFSTAVPSILYDVSRASCAESKYLIWDLYSKGMTSCTNLVLNASKNVCSGVPAG